jgi:hypothetical protein
MTLSAEVFVAILALGGVALTTTGVVIGAVISGRVQKRAAKVQADANAHVAKNDLTDQLQEELARYREATDKRLDRLEEENRGYRAFIGVQRDHMAAHGIPLPPWPEGLPR